MYFKLKQNTKVNFMGGFTLIELLVVMAIIAVALGVSFFGLANSRTESRDNRRKADLETVRSALEIYKADCGVYPSSLSWGNQLIGSGTPSGCLVTNVYMQTLPTDAISGQNYYYSYNSAAGTYILCAALEGNTTLNATCGNNCGTSNCSYLVRNP